MMNSYFDLISPSSRLLFYEMEIFILLLRFYQFLAVRGSKD